MKIKVSEGVTKTFPEFDGGTPEDLIKLVRRHESLINDMGLEVQYKDLALQLKAKENEVAQICLSNCSVQRHARREGGNQGDEGQHGRAQAFSVPLH